MKTNRKGGFSLTELLVVIMIALFVVVIFRNPPVKSTLATVVDIKPPSLIKECEVCFIGKVGKMFGGWQSYTIINREGYVITAFGVPNLEQGEEVRILTPDDIDTLADNNEFYLIAR